MMKILKSILVLALLVYLASSAVSWGVEKIDISGTYTVPGEGYDTVIIDNDSIMVISNPYAVGTDDNYISFSWQKKNNYLELTAKEDVGADSYKIEIVDGGILLWRYEATNGNAARCTYYEKVK